MNRIVPATLLLGLLAGCSMDAGTGPTQGTAVFATAGASGCYTVSGTISETGVFPSFSGTIAGDLVGTSATTLSFDVRSTGALRHISGERTLVVTGGAVPALIGRTLHETFDGLTISEAHPVIRIDERTRVAEGVRLGDLTTHGTLDQAQVPWDVEVAYRGIICP
jgi:hypothetical protein